MLIRKIFLFLFLLPLSTVALADYKIGLMADVGMFTLEDPETSGSQRGDYIGAAITGSYPLKWRGQSVLSGVGYLTGSSSASTTNVGQKYSGYYVFSRWQIRTPISRNLPEMYSFFGAKYMHTKHKDRHTVYEGYLKDSFDDREVNALEFTMGASYKLKHESGSSSIPSFYIDFPLSGKIMLFGLSYQYEF